MSVGISLNNDSKYVCRCLSFYLIQEISVYVSTLIPTQHCGTSWRSCPQRAPSEHIGYLYSRKNLLSFRWMRRKPSCTESSKSRMPKERWWLEENRSCVWGSYATMKAHWPQNSSHKYLDGGGESIILILRLP